MSFSKAQDLLKLAMLATRRSGVLLEDIVEEFGCSYRTAQRMIEALETTFPQTESGEGEDRKKRWHLPARNVAALLSPSPEELAALSTGISQLEHAGMLQEASLIRNLNRKIRALVPPDKGTRLSVDEEALLEVLGHAARPGPRPATNPTVDTAIYEALKGPFLLRFPYRRRGQGKFIDRIVAPHGLLLGVRRYLVARDIRKPSSTPLQHFRVEEIPDAEVLPESFEFDPGFDIRSHADRGFGSYENEGELGEVEWRFSPGAAAHARRFVFHPTQVLEEEPDGSLLVRFRASGLLEMCWHLYSWGTAVEVVRPASLREMVHAYRRTFDALP